MASKAIPDNAKKEIAEIIDQFNKKSLHKGYGAYVPRYKGSYLYLDRDDGANNLSPICRLKYTGDMNKWEFAIYKYSTGQYDPEECFFPGEELIDGTIEGAMKAGLRAYD